MARQLPSIPLSKMTGGVSRFTDEARDDQCIDALNVIEREGALVRRPAFVPIATGAPYHLPAGQTKVAVETFSGGAKTEYANRTPTINVATQRKLYIGCVNPFDGFSWEQISTTPTESNITNNVRAKIKYITNANGSGSTIYGVVDTTVKHCETGSTSFYLSLFQRGRVSWNRNAFTWSAINLTGTTFGSLYWISVEFSVQVVLPGHTSTEVAIPCSAGSITLQARGVRAFLLNPINGIIPTRSRGRVPVTIVGSDIASRRGNIIGGGLGFIRRPDEQTQIAKLLEDEGAGIFGVVSQPQWVGGTVSLGTAFTLTKDRRDYSWRAAASEAELGQFDGAALLTLVPSAGGSSSTIPVTAGWEGSFNRDFSNHRARVTVQPGPGGPAVGEEREIWRSDSSATLIEIYPNWSAPLSGSETIEIRRQPSTISFNEGIGDFEIQTNAAHTAVIRKGGTERYVDEASAGPYNRFINFAIETECYWCLNPSTRWRAAFDSSTGATILTNGENGLLEYDGLRLRRLAALSDPTDGVDGAKIVQLWRGVVTDLVLAHNDPKLEQGSQLRVTPPNGKFIVDFMGRLVVANIREREQTLQWSAPGFFNALWPLTYETQIRDSENNPITGLATLNDELYVFTQTAIFKSGPANDRGELFFTPISQGIGFVSHEAVCRVVIGGSSMLVGVAPDGVYATDGGEPITLIDDWKRYLPRGVNVRQLHRAVVAPMMTENLIFIALPSSGRTSNDALLVLDVAQLPAKVWPWAAPTISTTVVDGITAIAHDFDEAGAEVMLFGHESGHISMLRDADLDGPSTVTGYARCKPIVVPDGATASFEAVLLRMSAIGSLLASVQPYTNGSSVGVYGATSGPEVTLSGPSNDATYDVSLYGTGKYATESDRTYRLNLPNGTVGEEFDFELRSSERFRYRGAVLLATPKGQRGY